VPPALADNAVAIEVSGPNGTGAGNPQRITTSLKICTPGSITACETIDNIIVDTGSTGLRLFTKPNITLPAVSAGSGVVKECAMFSSNSAWGQVFHADIQWGGRTASSSTLQVVGGSLQGTSNCDSGVVSIGYNGIIGVDGVTDCGAYCATGNTLYTMYWSCDSSSCTRTNVPLADQIQNPIPQFTQDNNGFAIQLPGVDQSGSRNVTGVMYFGIGTQSNNQLGAATVLTEPATIMAGGASTTLDSIDSGSFNVQIGPAIPGFAEIPVCGAFYCPSSPISVTFTVLGGNGATAMVPFVVANPSSLNSSAEGFNDLAGPYTGGVVLGLPFFYGRTIFHAFSGENTSGGVGPYYAF
jgi:hypothetical protein